MQKNDWLHVGLHDYVMVQWFYWETEVAFRELILTKLRSKDRKKMKKRKLIVVMDRSVKNFKETLPLS